MLINNNWDVISNNYVFGLFLIVNLLQQYRCLCFTFIISYFYDPSKILANGNIYLYYILFY